MNQDIYNLDITDKTSISRLRNTLGRISEKIESQAEGLFKQEKISLTQLTSSLSLCDILKAAQGLTCILSREIQD